MIRIVLLKPSSSQPPHRSRGEGPGIDSGNASAPPSVSPINSIIEFKQIIGRDTRLHDRKDYFAIYDFVMEHHHFSDPEWDGEPLAPDPAVPCVDRGGEPSCPCKKRVKAKVILGDGKERNTQHMMLTSFWYPAGTPMSAHQITNAEQSDIFDVLAHVAYALPPVTREERAANARVYCNTRFSLAQKAREGTTRL
jgi:type I restriction enzyme R subunit